MNIPESSTSDSVHITAEVVSNLHCSDKVYTEDIHILNDTVDVLSDTSSETSGIYNKSLNTMPVICDTSSDKYLLKSGSAVESKDHCTKQVDQDLSENL